MAEAHLDTNGEIRWFPRHGPAPVLGPCPHASCTHDMGGTVAWGPDYAHYSLSNCSVPAEQGGCAGTCRQWIGEWPDPIPPGHRRYEFGPFLHVDLSREQADR